MGVMSCSREDCENIMCDTYISSVGYICYECQNQFKEWLENNSIFHQTEWEIQQALKKFMDISKDSIDSESKQISVDQFFKNHTE